MLDNIRLIMISLGYKVEGDNSTNKKKGRYRSMIKLNNNLSDYEFLTMLDLLDEGDLIIAMGTVAPEITIEETDNFVYNMMDDIPSLLKYQSILNETITDYKYIKTGLYYNQTSVADTVFELFSNSDWLSYKDELIEFFNEY